MSDVHHALARGPLTPLVAINQPVRVSINERERQHTGGPSPDRVDALVWAITELGGHASGIEFLRMMTHSGAGPMRAPAERDLRGEVLRTRLGASFIRAKDGDA